MSAIRRPGTASATVLIALAGGFVAAHAAAPEWSHRVGLDVWNMPAVQDDYRATAEQEREIAARGERYARRAAAANQVAAQLLAGAIDLPRATDEVAALFADDPGAAVALLLAYPHAPTERLRLARHVIERTSRQFETAAQGRAVMARLEAEYQRMAAAPESPDRE